MLAAGLLPGLAAQAKPKKVLVMRVEGSDLSKKDRDDLFQVVAKRLKLYPTLELVRPAEGDITDQMMELECIDLDQDCLAKLGTQQGAHTVFFAQVDVVEGKSVLLVRVIRVRGPKTIRDQRTPVASRADLAGILEREVKASFGAPPKPKPKRGRLVVEATAKRSKIYVNGKYAGSRRVRLTKKPGTYHLRVVSKGFHEELFDVTVVAGKTTTRSVKLRPLPTTTRPGGKRAAKAPTDDDSMFKSWYFWTGVGTLVLGGVVAAAVALAGDDAPTPQGAVILSTEPSQAWKDHAIMGASP